MYHINVSKLNGKIAEAGTTKEALASKLGVARSTLARRIAGNALRIQDVHGICDALGLSASEAQEIFLAQ